MNIAGYSIFLLFLFSVCSCDDNKTHENEIVVFCASSLSPIMEKINTQWEKNHQEKIIINSASSGILARQIENGAKADIFLSANMDWIDHLLNSMSINKQAHNVASNRLVVVAPIDNDIDSIGLQDLLLVMINENGKISISDPGHVPLGKYTKESLDFYDVFDKMSSQMVNTKNARSALRLVELGEASFGFVYLSDALKSKKVQIVARIPEESHRPITYQAIIVNDSKSKTMDFFEFISSSETLDIWTKMGFE